MAKNAGDFSGLIGRKAISRDINREREIGGERLVTGVIVGTYQAASGIRVFIIEKQDGTLAEFDLEITKLLP